MNALFSEPDTHLKASFEGLRLALAAHGPLVAERRAAALDGIADMVLRHGRDLSAAISRDFGHRSADETRLAELFPVVTAARHARKNLRSWMKPERRPISMMFRPGRGEVVFQPLGVVGIISPWNYPVQLTLLPLIGAVAAGNRVMIKPSELTPETSALLASLLGEVFTPEEVAVVQGGTEVAKAFSRLRFDHLLFTGSTAVGREVMKAAAENLVPVTLELGGKTPALVAPDYSLPKAAERIAVGKLFNAGQTCIAPDYVLVQKTQEAAFVEAFSAATRRLYPAFESNPDYTAIISERHRARLLAMIDDARRLGGHVRSLDAENGLNDAGRKLAPVILAGLPDHAVALQEEIFGPVLPVVVYDTLQDAHAYINARPRPLALYLFSDDRETVRRTLERTVSGGVTVNDTLLHCVQEELPFGGVGDSGMGAYHGMAGFRTFSHAKAVFHQARLNGSALTRPPYGKRVEGLLKWVLR